MMLEVSLLLEYTKQRSHGGVGGRLGEVGSYLRRGRPAEPVEDVHDLSLSAREVCGCGPESKTSAVECYAFSIVLKN